MRRHLLISAALLFTFLPVTVDSSPAITSYEKVKTLNEGVIVNTQLSTIACSDSDGDATRVLVRSVEPGSPCGSCFTIVTCGADDCLQYRAGVGSLDHSSAGSYLITVACDDGIETPATEVIMVIIIPNSPPYFAALTDDVTVSAQTVIGDVVATAPATDDDGDALSYFLTVVPSTAQSGFTIDTSGTITALIDLRSLCVSFVTLEVTVSDGSNTVGPKVINLAFTDNLVRPIAINLDTILQVPENTAAGDEVYRFYFVSDVDLTYTVVATNVNGYAQFELSGRTLSVASGVVLDYETESLRTTELLITATDADGFCDSETYTLTVEITDVNEPPVISDDTTSIEICEGRTEFLPPFTWSDPDEYDTHVWTYFGDNNNDGVFFVHPTTGILGTNLEYDVDPDYDKPKQYSAEQRYKIEVTDKGGLTATATVSATFLDCNDNAPRFTQPFFTFTATECTASGVTLGTLDAIDADSDREGNNVITFSGAAGAVEVGATGQVILTEPLPAGTVLTFDVWATDQGLTPGNLVSEQPAKVSVIFGICPEPASATTEASSGDGNEAVSNSSANMPWVIIAGILGAVAVGLASIMLWKYSRLIGDSLRGACKSGPSQQSANISSSSKSSYPYHRSSRSNSDSFFY